MNTNKEQATDVALSETGTVHDTRKLSHDDSNSNRSFGVMDLWSIRQNTRTLKIHNRIPRL